jgi:hypothetical protein
MTAVEWYAEQAMKLEIEILHGKISTGQMLNQLSIVLKQAIEIENRKIECAYKKGKKHKKPLKDSTPITKYL